MKKVLFVAFMALAFVGMTSCQKDEDLSGTKWVFTETDTDTDEYDGVTYTYEYTLTVSLEFNSETAGVMNMVMSDKVNGVPTGSETDKTDYTYTYDGNGNGTITIIDEDTGKPETTNFTIVDNKLTISETEDGETYTMVFIKQ